MIQDIITISAAVVVFIFTYFSFGLWLISKLQQRFSVLETTVLAIATSVSGSTAVLAVLGQFLGTTSYYLLAIPTIIGIAQTRRLKSHMKDLYHIIVTNKLVSFIFLLTVGIFCSTIIFGGFANDGTLQLQEVHDSVWHIALIENLQASIPPVHPSTPEVVLVNYHYFYDLFLASIAQFSGVSLYILYIQFSVIFLSVFLLISAYVAGRSIHGKLAAYLLVAMTAIAGSASYIIPVLFHPEQAWHESSFWVSQTLVMIVNPQVIYTIALTYISIVLLSKLSALKKVSLGFYQLHAVQIILIATSIGFKSYAWVILSVVYAVFLLRSVFKLKSPTPVLIGVAYLLVSVPFVWLITRFQGNSFFYEPLWFTNTMIESPDRVNYLEWKFLQDHYIFKKNWIRLWILEAQKLTVFYLGNLGIRSLFLMLPVLLVFKKMKKQINWEIATYVFCGFLFSSVFPLLFLQRGTVWNSIQFWYYTLIFANVLFVMCIASILKNKPRLIQAVVLVLLFIAGIPTSIKTVQAKLYQPAEFHAVDTRFLSSLQPHDTVLICPEPTEYYETSLIKSISPATVYLANPSQLELVGSDTTLSDEFESAVQSQNAQYLKDLIADKNITHVICSDTHMTTIFESVLATESQVIHDLRVIEIQ